MPADGAEKGECTPDDAFYAPVRLHAIAPRHIRVSPYPNGDRCKATPLISTICQRLDTFVSRRIERLLQRIYDLRFVLVRQSSVSVAERHI